MSRKLRSGSSNVRRAVLLPSLTWLVTALPVSVVRIFCDLVSAIADIVGGRGAAVDASKPAQRVIGQSRGRRSDRVKLVVRHRIMRIEAAEHLRLSLSRCVSSDDWPGVGGCGQFIVCAEL